ncbi:hypothetical protein Q4493_16005 [Colwellia sp. 1_MG-2023]|uniref:2'-5' RNA ligase family protein n=1 Tax=Colwellia sp. 1_MG-2023 TaxID=3062649 RepID=UPI0026E27E66|nr:2'-5' RNA ligase family protein [Colwellia sp. 1_MG-2023]MDO6447274.1 hypothetical protein [Colwellia sp. 1_MG-2023]
MPDLKNLYSQMWLNSIDKFHNNNCEIDDLIHDQSDMRRGITVLSYLDNSVSENITNFLNELQVIEPEQYYYPRSELHLTILSVISCFVGFKLSSINVEDYSAIFQETMLDFEPFTINFKGITVSSSCILIQGFPESEQLNHLRDSLRANFNGSKLKTTIDSRYKLSTAHITAVRFRAPFKNNHQLMAVLSKFRNYDFGTLEIKSLDLVFNNWYQNLSITKSLSSANLKTR